MYSPDSPERANAIFEHIIEIPEPQRWASLAEACGSDTALHEFVSVLIHEYERTTDTVSPLVSNLGQRRGGALGELLFDRFRIVSFIASGGMGEVYRADDSRLGRTVALKFLSEEFAEDRRHIAHFRSEAMAASALNHPNICTVYDFAEDNGRTFIAMEYLD